MGCGKAQKETVGPNEGAARPAERGVFETPRSDSRPTLAEQGIDKNLAKQARTLGALSEKQFEGLLVDTRDAVARATKNVMREAIIEGPLRRDQALSVASWPAIS